MQNSFYTSFSTSFFGVSSEPFGTMQDGRKGQTVQASLYNAGFQGQRTDDEIKGDGNSIDYKFRMHDPRIGRFFAVDPLASKYPKWSPYAFSGNQVIHTFELEGLEPWQDLNDADPDKMYQGKNIGNEKDNTVYNWKVQINTFEGKETSRQWVIQDEYKVSKEELAEMSNHVYNIFDKGVGYKDQVPNTNFFLLKKYGSDDGYKAALYANYVGDGTYYYVMAFAGTDDLSDVGTDAIQGTGNISGHVSKAIIDAVKVDNWVSKLDNGNNLIFTGHSLGGGLASVASFSTNRKTTTFNAMGITWQNENAYPFDYVNNQYKNIDAYIINGEALNRFQAAKADGTKHYLNASKSTFNTAELHSLDRFLEIYRK